MKKKILRLRILNNIKVPGCNVYKFREGCSGDSLFDLDVNIGIKTAVRCMSSP